MLLDMWRLHGPEGCTAARRLHPGTVQLPPFWDDRLAVKWHSKALLL